MSDAENQTPEEVAAAEEKAAAAAKAKAEREAAGLRQWLRGLILSQRGSVSGETGG